MSDDQGQAHLEAALISHIKQVLGVEAIVTDWVIVSAVKDYTTVGYSDTTYRLDAPDQQSPHITYGLLRIADKRYDNEADDE